MSLRFFTNTRVGELMSRLNNDVVGAQNAISNTIVAIITNIIQAIAVLVVMLSMEWRLTLISMMIMPLFILAARRWAGLAGYRPRTDGCQRLDERHDERNAQYRRGAVGQAVWAQEEEVERFEVTRGRVRNLGINRAVWGSPFCHHRPAKRRWHRPGLRHRRLSGHPGAFTIGTIVAFGAYLGSLYGALQQLTNAPVISPPRGQL